MMGDWWDTARDAFPEHGKWALLAWPIVRMWKLFWQMVIFAMRKDLYDRVLLDLEREQMDHDRERDRRIEAEQESDRLRHRLDDFYDSRSAKLAGDSYWIGNERDTNDVHHEDSGRSGE